MIGKMRICAVSVALLAAPASAGMVVTDPGSYSYYVEQIKQQVELIDRATKQVETMGGVLTEAQKIQSNLTGHYNRAVSLVNRINRLSNAFSQEASGGIFGVAKKWGNIGRQIGGVGSATAGMIGKVGKDVNEFSGDDLYVDTKAMLDEVFTDPRSIDNAADRYRSLDRRYQIQQGALKEVVARSEKTLGDMGDRLKLVQELAGLIDKTENQKDAQDLGNRILVEILAALTDMIQIAALANQANALAQYQGASDAAMQERQKVIEDVKASASGLIDRISSGGFRRDGSGGGLFGGRGGLQLLE
jgi:tetratricopeptide (TPR) repeat protein